MNIPFKRIFIVLFVTASLQGAAQRARLIEFGWDHPDVDQLSKALPTMQNTPFDGICFSFKNKIMEAFDTAVHSDDYFGFDKLKSLQWGKYNDNFIILRGFGITGGRWFEDAPWDVFTRNMKAVSRALSSGNIKGILFDPEYYYPNKMYNPWTYSKTQYPDKSLEEVQEAVKKRGIQFISALQTNKPDLVFLSIWIASYIVEELKIKPIQDTWQALLPSFIEGVLEGKNNAVKVIDGNEYGYWFRSPSQFLEAAAHLKKGTADLMKSDKAKSASANITIAQPLFYDGLMGMAAPFDKGYDNTTKWKWLEENTKYAMATSDEYVWFYSQRIDWWKGKVNDTLVRILENSKAALSTDALLRSSNPSAQRPALSNSITANDEKGYYYYADPKIPMKTGDVAFSFKWNAGSKTLQVNFTGKVPETISVFAGNTSATVDHPKTSMVTISLASFTSGKMIILAKYDKTLEASGFRMYN